jgi:ureidoacrylate peracid hydrolase
MNTSTDAVEGIAAEHMAILVVDMQNDFCSPDGALAQAGADLAPTTALIPAINKLIDRGRRAGALPVFIAYVSDTRFAARAHWTRTAAAGRTPSWICQPGSWGAEFHRELAVRAEDLVITKRRYSAFIGTDLELLLRAHRIEALVVVGTTANVCIDSTVRDGFQRGFEIVVPRDLVGRTHDDLAEASMQNLGTYFAALCDSTSLWPEDRERALHE